jgi:hypothetical protein
MTQNSLIKIHQPLSLENRNYMKNDRQNANIGRNNNNNNVNSNNSNNNNNMNKYN